MLAAAIGVFGVHWGLLAWDVLGHHRHRTLQGKEVVRYGLHLGLLLVLTALCLVLEYQASVMPVFGGLAVLALFSPTLDEWTEGRELPAVERWTHALLYLFQPLAILMVAALWPFTHGVGFFAGIVLPFGTEGLRPALIGYCAALTLLLGLHLFLRGTARNGVGPSSSEGLDPAASAGRIERSS